MPKDFYHACSLPAHMLGEADFKEKEWMGRKKATRQRGSPGSKLRKYTFDALQAVFGLKKMGIDGEGS